MEAGRAYPARRLSRPLTLATLRAMELRSTYPLDNALYLWEEGFRRLRGALADPETSYATGRAVRAIDDELRRRLGPTFQATQLAALYGEGTDWCMDAVRRVVPFESVDMDPSTVVDGAFFEHLRNATDWAGGRLQVDEDVIPDR